MKRGETGRGECGHKMCDANAKAAKNIYICLYILPSIYLFRADSPERIREGERITGRDRRRWCTESVVRNVQFWWAKSCGLKLN